MKNRYLVFIFTFIVGIELDAQLIDTIYVDRCGYQATKQDYDYYQVLEQENDLIKVTGYKKSGRKFMEGHLRAVTQEKTGAFYYYKKNRLYETELYEIDKNPDIKENYKDVLTYFPDISDSEILVIRSNKNGKIKYLGINEGCMSKGIWYYFFDGELSYTLTYRDNILDGPAIDYWDKKPYRTGFYKNGKKDGDWRYYDENCKLTKTVRYVNGKKKEVIYPESE